MRLWRKPRVKVIKATARLDLPDDTSYPYKLYVDMVAPDLGMGYILLYGSREEFVVCGMSLRALQKFFDKHKFEKNPRFRKCEVTDRNDTVLWSVRQGR